VINLCETGLTNDQEGHSLQRLFFFGFCTGLCGLRRLEQDAVSKQKSKTTTNFFKQKWFFIQAKLRLFWLNDFEGFTKLSIA
jgi:hypothetical protein